MFVCWTVRVVLAGGACQVNPCLCASVVVVGLPRGDPWFLCWCTTWARIQRPPWHRHNKSRSPERVTSSRLLQRVWWGQTHDCMT